LIPIINSSAQDENYITSIFNYLTENISDLNLLQKLIHYTRKF
jgi:hypothetical protein